MRFLAYRSNGLDGLAVQDDKGNFHGLTSVSPDYPGALPTLLTRGHAALAAAYGVLRKAATIDLGSVEVRPPIANPSKIICVGLNYVDHSKESGFEPPTYPTLFARFASSLIGHEEPIVRPRVSDKLDYEGELVAVIGKGGRHIAKDRALDHVAGYSIFNDGSIRDYQMKTPQWTIGKNFDSTGGFGPVFVTADELPPGARGLSIETRLNGRVLQKASTDDLIFDIASLVSILSEAFTLETNDIIVSGTPAGVGLARKPPIFMKPGDICEVEIEKIGILRNPVVDEARAAASAAA